MIYELTVSSPYTVGVTVQARQPWRLEKGVIRALRVYFPVGSANLLHVQVLHGATQIFPKGSGSFSGHGGLLEHVGVDYPLLSAPYELVVCTWNLSSRFAHTVYLYLDISRAGFFVR